jgi:hypothetical protein
VGDALANDGHGGVRPRQGGVHAVGAVAEKLMASTIRFNSTSQLLNSSGRPIFSSRSTQVLQSAASSGGLADHMTVRMISSPSGALIVVVCWIGVG